MYYFASKLSVCAHFALGSGVLLWQWLPTTAPGTTNAPSICMQRFCWGRTGPLVCLSPLAIVRVDKGHLLRSRVSKLSCYYVERRGPVGI